SMRYAIEETNRRRRIQNAYNTEHGIEPQGIVKAIRDITDSLRKVAEDQTVYNTSGSLPKEELARMVLELEKQMKKAAKDLEFEKAAMLRDQVVELRKALMSDEGSLLELAAAAGKDGKVPFSEAVAPKQREVSYRPGRRGAKYRR
ncbi:MAG: UvrB/UvrC motif-containing protein, partial [Dehalococcoidia bacterium]